MIAHIIDTLKAMSIPVIIVSNNSEYTQFGVPVIPDEFKDKGPLVGIYSGLLHSNTETNFVVSCDTPYVSNTLIQLLIDEHKDHQISVASYRRKLHPTIGVFDRSITPHLLEAIEQESLKLQIVFEALNYQVVPVDELNSEIAETVFTNVNTQTELNNLTI